MTPMLPPMAPPPSHSFHFNESSIAASPSEPALDLTASDGTGLLLVSLTARVVIDDPLAFTELHLVFENPEPRQLEGRFRITLPQGASVSRFAMRQGERWQEGEVVERQAARRAYEDFLHRRQDPALLEHESGNEFSARVYPIEARGRKELILSYGHELTRPEDPYRLPLIGLPQLAQLDVRALVSRSEGAELSSSLGGSTKGYQVIEVRKSQWKPDIDFEVRAPAVARSGLRSGGLLLARVYPDLPTEPEEIGSLLVLLDTSASRSLGHVRQIDTVLAMARALAAGAGGDTPLAVACFDQSVFLAFEGTAAGFGEAEAAKLRARPALGASDLEAALRWAASRQGPRYERAILVSDGVATAGQIEPEKLREAARGLREAGVRRLDALAAGGLRDDASLRRLVTAGLEKDGVVCDADRPLPEIGDRLTRATRSGIKVEVPGASWVWPQRLDAVQPGDAILVYADLTEERAPQILLDGKPAELLALDPCERPLLERAWVQARIARLEAIGSDPATDPDVRSGLKKQIIDLSVRHRVLCSSTALLILETESDYQRHGIDRRSLSDILTVGLGGIELLHRSAAAPTPPPAKPKPPAKADMAEKSKKMARSGERASPLDRDEEGGPEAKGEAAPAFEPGVVSDAVSESYSEEDEQEEEEEEEEVASAFEDVGRIGESRDTNDGISAGSLAGDAPAAPGGAPPPAAPMTSSSSVRRASMPSPGAAPMAPPPPAPMAPPAPAAPAMAPPPPAARPMVSARSMAMPSPAQSAPMPSSSPSPDLRDSMSAPSAAPSPAREEAPSPLRRLANAVTEFFAPSPEAAAPPPAAPPPAQPVSPVSPPLTPMQQAIPQLTGPLPWSGPFLEVMTDLLQGNTAGALARALAWLARSPGDVLALVAVAQAAEACGDLDLAARACGAIIDLYPSRADLRRFAGERLEKLGQKATLELAIDTYRKSVESRADHPSGHRLLGLALLRAGRPAEAFEVLATAQARSFDSKFPGIPRILTEDLGLAAAAWIRVDPTQKTALLARLARAGATLETAPSVRFVLVWETDANDVDFHIHDAQGGHAYYASKLLPSGGELYADVTQGYGPECFTIRTAPGQRVYPYKLEAHYFSRGPMGYGMGTLQILEHDGQGNFAFEDRPYIVMEDRATVALGLVTAPLPVAR
jgi:hypothetical protein